MTHAAQLFVQGHADRMELVPVVVVGQAGDLLVGVGIELDDRLRPEAVVLLATRDERLFEPRADAFARDQPQVPCAARSG